MNMVVDAWNRAHQSKPEEQDSITVDGEERFFGEKKMENGVTYVLTKQVFNKYVRMAKTLGLSRVKEVRSITWETLKRLGVKRDLSKAVRGIPKGSDQLNIGSLVLWLRSVPGKESKNHDEKAVEQVVILDATLHNRIVG